MVVDKELGRSVRAFLLIIACSEVHFNLVDDGAKKNDPSREMIRSLLIMKLQNKNKYCKIFR